MDPVGERRKVIVGGIGDFVQGGYYDVAIVGLEAEVGQPSGSVSSVGKLGIAIGGHQSNVSAGAYGVAIGGRGATAVGGALALVYNGGTARVADGGVAVCRDVGNRAQATNGVAYGDVECDVVAGDNGSAITRRGSATAEGSGFASIRDGERSTGQPGTVSAGHLGIAVAWNQPLKVTADGDVVHDEGVSSSFGVISVGEGGVAISFLTGTDGKRQCVVGLTKGDPAMNVPFLIQFGLISGAKYRLSQNTGLFERV